MVAAEVVVATAAKAPVAEVAVAEAAATVDAAARAATADLPADAVSPKKSPFAGAFLLESDPS